MGVTSTIAPSAATAAASSAHQANDAAAGESGDAGANFTSDMCERSMRGKV